MACIHGNTDTALTQTQSQRGGQRLGQKTIHHHQQTWLRRKQYIGGITGAGHPNQRDAGHRDLQRQDRGFHTGRQPAP